MSAVLLDSTVGRAHVSAAGAPKKKRDGAGPRPQSGRLQHPDPHFGGSTEHPPCLRVTSGPRHDSTQTQGPVEAWRGAPLPCLIADPGPMATLSALGWRNGTSRPFPARRRRTYPQPHDPEQYKARNAVERGIGWLKHGRRVATRYNKRACIFLVFLCLAGAWIWMKPKIHTA